MSALTPEQEQAAEIELAEREAEREEAKKKEPTIKERFFIIEKTIAQLVVNQNTIVQSLASLNKQAPASPSPQNQPAPQQAGQLSPEIIAQILPALLGSNSDSKENIFETLGRAMVENFSKSYVNQSARIFAKKGFLHNQG